MKKTIIDYMIESLEVSAEDAAELFDMYLETLDEHCVKMQAAVDKADFAEIRLLTHSLTGCSGNVGAEYIVEAVRELNAAAKALNKEQCQAAFAELLTRRDTLHNA